jgi:hypothetical protein
MHDHVHRFQRDGAEQHPIAHHQGARNAVAALRLHHDRTDVAQGPATAIGERHFAGSQIA